MQALISWIYRSAAPAKADSPMAFISIWGTGTQRHSLAGPHASTGFNRCDLCRELIPHDLSAAEFQS